MARYDLTDRDQIEAERKRRSKEIQERRKKKASQRRPPGADTVPKESKRRPAGASTTSAAIEELISARARASAPPRPSVGSARRSLTPSKEELYAQLRQGLEGPNRDPVMEALTHLPSYLADRTRSGAARLEEKGALAADLDVGRDLVDLTVGPNIRRTVEGDFSNVDPKWLGVEAAGLLPIGKLAKPLRGALAARNAAKAARLADAAADTVAALDNVVIPEAKLPMRRIGPGVEIPGARARTGRVVEDVIDKVRPTVSGATGGVVQPKRIRSAIEHARTRDLGISRELGAQRDTLARLVDDLDAVEEHALIVKNQRTRPVSERIAEEARLAEEATDDTIRANHTIQLNQLQKMLDDGIVVDTPNGVEWGPNASRKLVEAGRIGEEIGGQGGMIENIEATIHEQTGGLAGMSRERLDAARLKQGRIIAGARMADDTRTLAEIPKAERAAAHVGQWVVSLDRGMSGKILSLDKAGTSAKIRYWNRASGATVRVVIPLDQLRPATTSQVLKGADDAEAVAQFFSSRPGMPGSNVDVRKVSNIIGAFGRPSGLAGKTPQIMRLIPKGHKTMTGRAVETGNVSTQGGRIILDRSGEAISAYKKFLDRRFFLDESVDALPLPENLTPDAWEEVKKTWQPIFTDEALLSERAVRDSPMYHGLRKDGLGHAEAVAIVLSQPDVKIASKGREQMKRALRAMNEFGVDDADDVQRLREAGDGLSEFARADLFPDEEVRARLFDDALENLGEIPGVRWVPTDVVKKVTTPPTAILHAVMDTDNKVFKGLMGFAKAHTLYTKAALLFGATHYGPANLSQNLYNIATGQGIYAIPNSRIVHTIWKRAGGFGMKEGPYADLLKFLDAVGGEGFALSAEQAPSVLQGATHAIAQKMGAVIDIGPRRTAMVHAARRDGLKTPEQILASARKAWLGDADELKRWDNIGRVAKDMAGDYERIRDPMAKAVASGFFIAPWHTAALHHTLRFPLNHPFQAAALAGGAAWYMGDAERRREALGFEWVPESMKTWMPFDDRGDSAFGFDPFKYIMPGQPIDDVKSMIGLIQGNPELARQAAGNFMPLIEQTVASLWGVDSFGNPVEPGVVGMAKRAVEPFTEGSIQRAGRLAVDAAGGPEYPLAAKDSLKPRTFKDEVLRVALGSQMLYPAGKEKAKEIALRNLPTEERQQVNDADDLAEQMDAYSNFPLDDEQFAALEESLRAEQWISRRRDDLYKAARDELETDNLPKREELRLGALAAVERLEEDGHPLAEGFRDAYEAALEERDLSLFEDIMEAAERRLGIDFLREARSAARKRGYLAE